MEIYVPVRNVWERTATTDFTSDSTRRVEELLSLGASIPQPMLKFNTDI